MSVLNTTSSGSSVGLSWVKTINRNSSIKSAWQLEESCLINSPPLMVERSSTLRGEMNKT